MVKHTQTIRRQFANYLSVFDQFVVLALNTLTANYEYSRNNTDNLPLPVQMQLSRKRKTFSTFSKTFFDSTLNFEYFEKKVGLIAQVFLKLLTPADVFT